MQRKSKTTPEGEIKHAIFTWLTLQPKAMAFPVYNGGIFDPVRRIYRKPNSRFYRAGVPDILGIWDGKPLAIEVKTKTGVVSEDQKGFLSEFSSRGGIAILARSLEEVVAALS